MNYPSSINLPFGQDRRRNYVNQVILCLIFHSSNKEKEAKKPSMKEKEKKKSEIPNRKKKKRKNSKERLGSKWNLRKEEQKKESTINKLPSWESQEGLKLGMFPHSMVSMFQIQFLTTFSPFYPFLPYLSHGPITTKWKDLLICVCILTWVVEMRCMSKPMEISFM